MKSIYLAGPDVFELNAIELGNEYSKTCEKYGFKGLFPLDNVINFSQEKEEIAKEIFTKNCELIDKANIIIANLNPFRGKEADSGTVWECGYAFAKGKEVYGYMDDLSSYVKKFDDKEKHIENGKYLDNNNKEIENFNLPINLMIACSTVKLIQGSLEDVLIYLNNTSAK